jgi:hypothetical protein
MKTRRKVVGIALLVLGGAGLVLSLAGVAGVWVVRGPLRERLARAFGRVERVLATADADLRTVRAALDRSRQTLSAAREEPSPPARDGKKRSPLMKVAATTITQELAPRAGDLGTTLGRVNEAAVVANTLLEDFDKLSFAGAGKLDAEGLRGAEELLAEVTRTTQALGGLFPDDPSGKAEEARAAQRALDRVEELAAACEARVEETAAGVRRLESRADVWTSQGPVVATVLLLWTALGQGGLLLHGRSLLRKQPAGGGGPGA